MQRFGRPKTPSGRKRRKEPLSGFWGETILDWRCMTHRRVGVVMDYMPIE